MSLPPWCLKKTKLKSVFLPTSTLEKFQIAQLGDVNLRTIHEDRDANECLNPETSATNAVGSFANIFFFHTKYMICNV